MLSISFFAGENYSRSPTLVARLATPRRPFSVESFSDIGPSQLLHIALSDL